MTFVQKGVIQDYLALSAILQLSEAPLGLSFSSLLKNSLNPTVRLAFPIILVTVSISEKMT